MIQYIYVMYNDRDVSMQGHCVSGTINLGTSRPRKFVRGHIVSGRPITPPTGMVGKDPEESFVRFHSQTLTINSGERAPPGTANDESRGFYLFFTT